MTLSLLWQEYKESHPDGLQYSWFCDQYRAWAGKLDLVMRQDHRASEKVFERRESEARHLVDATETKHARAIRSWTASRDPSPRPTRDSAEASVRKEHWSAVLEAFEVACYGVGGRGEAGALALGPDERARLARYLAEERLPRTTPYASNPSHRPLAVSDATFDTAEAAAGTRRVAETNRRDSESARVHRPGARRVGEDLQPREAHFPGGGSQRRHRSR